MKQKHDMERPTRFRIVSIIRLLPILVWVALLIGCAHQQRFTWLSDQELTRCKEVALESAGSAEAWQRLKSERLTDGPLKLDASKVEYRIHSDYRDRITVIIPSGGRYGFHACYVAVTVARGKFELLSMEESFWP